MGNSKDEINFAVRGPSSIIFQVNMSLQGCASRCARNIDINCKAFSYQNSTKLCHLYEHQADNRERDSPDWILYEDKAEPHVKLMGGDSDNRGWVQINMKAKGQTAFGGICDNGRIGSNEARHLFSRTLLRVYLMM